MQSENLVKLVNYIYASCPVYKKKIDDAGITPGDIKSIDDIFIDFDLDKDTSWDWDTTNDRDFYLWNENSKFNIILTNAYT